MSTGPTLEEKFCAQHGCDPAGFQRRVFWKCLHRRALPFAPFLLLVYSRYFEPDREVIRNLGKATDMKEVWEEVREFFVNPSHQGWLRRRLEIRISARRLITLAREYLPGSPPPIYSEED